MTHAEQLNQYVAELEEYVAKHGHLPAAARSTPATNRRRLETALVSLRTDEALKRRLSALLDAPRYGSRHSIENLPRKARARNIAPILDYLDRLEGHLSKHGQLPPSQTPGPLKTDKARLHRYANHPDLDESVKQRSLALLGQVRTVRAVASANPEEFAALASAVATLSTPLRGIQAEALNWIIAERRLPSPVSSDPQERNYYRCLGQARRSSIRGTATLRTAELVLLVPGLLTAEERVQASAQAASRQAEAAEREARKNRLGSLEDRWNKGFEELSSWVEAHGTLPRRRTFDAEEYRVANWLNVQRMQLRDNNLRQEWTERLAAIPCALEPRKQLRGEAELAKTVADFYERHGRLPRADAPAPESTVGGRLQKLRSRISDRTIGRDALKVLSAIPGAATEVREQKPPMQRLADLEDFVRTTGTFPAKNTGGLSNWAYRALHGQGSKRAPEAISLRAAVAELRDSVPYKVHREKPALVEYVSCLEQYVAAHGHLPSSSKGAVPRLRPERLESALASETTDDVLRERIRKVMAVPARPRGRRAA